MTLIGKFEGYSISESLRGSTEESVVFWGVSEVVILLLKQKLEGYSLSAIQPFSLEGIVKKI